MRKKTLAVIGIGIVIVFIVGFMGYKRVDDVYRTAIKSYKSGNYKESKQLFNEVEWYRNSDEWIKSCDIEIRNKDYLKAKELMKEEKYEDVCKITVNYSDNDREMDILKTQANAELARERQRQVAQKEKAQKDQRDKYLSSLTEPTIGMTRDELISVFGKPDDINKSVGSWGVKEQFCYPKYKYVYVHDGVVTSYQGDNFKNKYNK